MKLNTTLAILAFVALFPKEDAAEVVSPDDTKNRAGKFHKKSMMEGKKISHKKLHKKSKSLTLRLTNLAYQQPWSGFFVMVHSSDAEPLFTFGKPAGRRFSRLAEEGNTNVLVNKYHGTPGVCYAFSHNDGAPYGAGEGPTIHVELTKECDLVTIASMAINTNDCFVALNGVRVKAGEVYFGDGLDAGSEENNELCTHIPGPACPNSSNERSRRLDDEGVVHVHRGFHGVGDLSAAGYDWRNPMMQVVVEKGGK